MTPCPACGTHRRPASACPHCGSSPTLGRTSVAAVMLGLALVGCSGDKSGGDTDATGDTGDTDTTPTTGVDYGVAMSAELEHGPSWVPETPAPPEVEGVKPTR